MTKDRYEKMGSLSGFKPTLNGNGGVGLVSQRDKTQLISEFDQTDFCKSRRILYIPSFQFLTLDDEIMKTRSQKNPVKSMSNKKADREGQSADVVADALFRFVIELRLIRKEEGRAEYVL